MRQNIAWITLVLLALAPVAFAAKGEKGDKGPSAAQIEKANARVTFDKDNMCAHTNAKGKKATFCPADIGHLNDEERGKGCIIGKLDTERNTEDGLTPGQYHVYMRREGSKWQIFYIQKDKVIAQAKSVKQGMDNEHKPSFVDAGTRIRYWELQFSF